MNNTDKLLRAFIEASGFEIEETQKVFIKGVLYKGNSSLIPVDDLDSVEIINDYKVTKKKTTRELSAQGRLNHAMGRMGQQ